MQAIYLHKQHSSSNKKNSLPWHIYFRSSRECNRSSSTHQGSHDANTAHQSSSLCPEKRKITKFQIRILNTIFLCLHKLNGTHFTRYFLYHHIQCGTKVTWRYRQHGNWKLLTQHLNLLCVLNIQSIFLLHTLPITSVTDMCVETFVAPCMYNQCKPNAYKIRTTLFFIL